MMKKRIVYNEQVKTLMLTVEAIRSYGGLPEEVAEKVNEFCLFFLSDTHNSILLAFCKWSIQEFL